MLYALHLLLGSLCLSSGYMLRGWSDCLSMPDANCGRRTVSVEAPPISGPFDEGFATFTVEFDDTGFMRTIRPLGICYQTSRNGTDSSEIATQLILLEDQWTVNLHLFDDVECSSPDPAVVTITMDHDGVYVPSHEKDLKKALKLPRWATGGYLWTSYITEGGCVGHPAGWELGVTGCATAGIMGDRRLATACNSTDNSLVVFEHNATTDYICEDPGELLYERPAECSMYSSLGKYGVDESGPLFQTNQCIKAKGKPKSKSKPHKNVKFFDRIMASIKRFFNQLETLFE